jgi:hypothetical protein
VRTAVLWVEHGLPGAGAKVADPIVALFSSPRLNWRTWTTADAVEKVDLKYWSWVGSALIGGFPEADGITENVSTAMLRLFHRSVCSSPQTTETVRGD